MTDKDKGLVPDRWSLVSGKSLTTGLSMCVNHICMTAKYQTTILKFVSMHWGSVAFSHL